MAETTKVLGTIPVNREEYSPSKNYYKDNVVMHNNCAYYCKVAGPISNSEPSLNNNNWGLWSGTEVVQELGNSKNKVVSQNKLTTELNNKMALYKVKFSQGFINSNTGLPGYSETRIYTNFLSRDTIINFKPGYIITGVYYYDEDLNFYKSDSTKPYKRYTVKKVDDTPILPSIEVVENISSSLVEGVQNDVDIITEAVEQLDNKKLSISSYMFDDTTSIASKNIITNIKFTFLDPSYIGNSVKDVHAYITYMGKHDSKWQCSFRIDGLVSPIYINGDNSKFDAPSISSGIYSVTIGNSVLQIDISFRVENFLENYTIATKLSDTFIFSQIAKYIKADIAPYLEKNLSPIQGNTYLSDVCKYIQLSKYQFISGDRLKTFSIGYFDYNVNTRKLYISWAIDNVVTVYGRDEYTEVEANSDNLVIFDYEKNGVGIKAVFDVSILKSNIAVNCNLANSKFSSAVTFNSSITTLEDLNKRLTIVENRYENINFISNYINERSTENCAFEMYQTLDWNKKTPKFNMALACDFHQEVATFRDLCSWSNDSAINNSLSAIMVAGDFISSGQALSKASWINQANKVTSAFGETRIPVLFCQGNHDKNWEQAGNHPELIMSDSEVRQYIYNPAYERLSDVDKSNFHFASEDSLYYYYDKNINDKIFRFIVINEYDLPETINDKGARKYTGTDDYTGKCDVKFATYISKNQFNFIINTLSSTPDDYVVLLVKHTPQGDTQLANSHVALKQLVKDFKSKNSGVININQLDDIDAFSIAYDFSNKTDSTILVVNGHLHVTYFNYDSSYGTYRLQGTCLGTSGENLRILNSVTEANCDVLSINTDTKATKLLRYGVAKIIDSEKRYINQDELII